MFFEYAWWRILNLARGSAIRAYAVMIFSNALTQSDEI